jgi:hypothetical protein
MQIESIGDEILISGSTSVGLIVLPIELSAWRRSVDSLFFQAANLFVTMLVIHGLTWPPVSVHFGLQSEN